MAFDTLHVYLRSKPIPRNTRRALAAFLDFGACENAAIDGKQYSPNEHEANQQMLLNSGRGPLLSNYVTQLRGLEKLRPLPGGDLRTFEDVRAYREAVAKLSLETITAVVFAADDCGDSGGRTELCRSELIRRRRELEMLFRIVMQCQIIDDVLDYSRDAAAGLPSFLTATAEIQQSIQSSGEAVRTYENVECLSPFAATTVLRMALFGVSNLAKAVLGVRQWQYRIFGAVRFPAERKPIRR